MTVHTKEDRKGPVATVAAIAVIAAAAVAASDTVITARTVVAAAAAAAAVVIQYGKQSIHVRRGEEEHQREEEESSPVQQISGAALPLGLFLLLLLLGETNHGRRTFVVNRLDVNRKEVLHLEVSIVFDILLGRGRLLDGLHHGGAGGRRWWDLDFTEYREVAASF